VKLTCEISKKPLCFAIPSRWRYDFSAACFSRSWSGKTGKTKKDTNARVAQQKNKTKQKNCAWITVFQPEHFT